MEMKMNWQLTDGFNTHGNDMEGFYACAQAIAEATSYERIDPNEIAIWHSCGDKADEPAEERMVGVTPEGVAAREKAVYNGEGTAVTMPTAAGVMTTQSPNV